MVLIAGNDKDDITPELTVLSKKLTAYNIWGSVPLCPLYISTAFGDFFLHVALEPCQGPVSDKLYFMTVGSFVAYARSKEAKSCVTSVSSHRSFLHPSFCLPKAYISWGQRVFLLHLLVTFLLSCDHLFHYWGMFHVYEITLSTHKGNPLFVHVYLLM